MLIELSSDRAEVHERQRDVGYDPERLKRRRLELGYTERMMADLLGMKYQNYQFYERSKAKGGYAPKGARMAQIARILETSAKYLRGETDNSAPQTEELSEDELEVLRAYWSGDLKRLSELFAKKARKDMGK